jgi:hypothetical protein
MGCRRGRRRHTANISSANFRSLPVCCDGEPYEENVMSIYRNVLKTSVLAIALCVGLPALAQTPPPPERQTTTTTERTTDDGVVTTTTTTTKHRYVYYADHDIYFAPETRTYYWQSDGHWRTGTVLPPEDEAYIRAGGVTVELDTERPYERHDWVVRHYKHHHDDDGQ